MCEHRERAAVVLICKGLKKLGSKQTSLELLPKSDLRKRVRAGLVRSLKDGCLPALDWRAAAYELILPG